jgi:hypothetical protein
MMLNFFVCDESNVQMTSHLKDLRVSEEALLEKYLISSRTHLCLPLFDKVNAVILYNIIIAFQILSSDSKLAYLL